MSRILGRSAEVGLEERDSPFHVKSVEYVLLWLEGQSALPVVGVVGQPQAEHLM